MTTISDLIQQRKNLSGIFTGAGGDRVPPHGTTHVKLGPDPIPQEIDGIPVDLEGINAGETIVLDAEGNLVPGAALGALVSLQTAYSNGSTINATTDDLIFQIATGTKFDLRDTGGNPIFRFSDVASVATLLLSADVLTLKDSNTTTPIAIGGVGDPVFSTTKQSIIGAVNEVWASVASLLVAPTAHASTHEDGGSDEINAGNLSGTGEVGKAFTIADAITGNPDAKIEQRSLTEIYAGDVVAGELCGYFSRSIATEKYVFALSQNSGGLLLKWDRFTGVYLGSTTASNGGQGALIFNDDYVAQLYTSNIRRYDQEDISQNDTVTATGLLFPYGDAALDSSGDAYAVGYIDPDSILQKVEDPFSDSPSVTTVRAITETGAWGDRIRSICVSSDDNYIFASSSNGADTVLKLVKSDGTVSASNTFTVAFSSFDPSLKCETDHLKIIHGNVVGRLSLSDLSTIDSWAVPSLDTPNGSFYDGVFYDVAYDTTPQAQLKAYQFPALTIQSPAHFDGYNIDSSAISQYRDADGNRIVHSFADFQRSEILASALDTTRLGFDVLSVVASTDSEITNAVVGQRYLISDDSNLNNYVFEMRSDGPHWYSPTIGATVLEKERGIYHDYLDGQWVPRTDTAIRGTVTIPSGTAVGTWTSAHIQFNNGDPMMLNTDDLHMLECDYKILSRQATGRSFLHRSNRVDIAPEYQVSSYADDIDHGGIQGATAASSYVNIDAETAPDKSGIIYAELVIEIPILTTADIELNYDIRLKGSIFYDAGTYDC